MLPFPKSDFGRLVSGDLPYEQWDQCHHGERLFLHGGEEEREQGIFFQRTLQRLIESSLTVAAYGESSWEELEVEESIRSIVKVLNDNPSAVVLVLGAPLYLSRKDFQGSTGIGYHCSRRI